MPRERGANYPVTPPRVAGLSDTDDSSAAADPTREPDDQQAIRYNTNPTETNTADWIETARIAGTNYAYSHNREKASDYVDAMFQDAEHQAQTRETGAADVTMYLRKVNPIAVAWDEAGPGNRYSGFHQANYGAQNTEPGTADHSNIQDFQWSSIGQSPSEHADFMKSVAYFAVTAGDHNPAAAARIAHKALDCAVETDPLIRERTLSEIREANHTLITSRT